MPINRLKASKRLKELGFNEDQSEGLAQLLSELGVASATKDDLDKLEERLTGRIDDLESRLEKLDEKVATQSDLEATESRIGERIERMEKRLLVVGIPAVAALMALLNYLMA